MQNEILILHGFNDFDSGSDNVDLLAPYFEEYGYSVDIKSMDYGWRGLLGALLFNGKSVNKLLKEYSGQIIVAYSNGCAIVARAIDKGLPVEKCIFIHPALNNDWEPSNNIFIKEIVVYHSHKDKAVSWAAKIPLVLWGDMGNIGSTSGNPIFKNISDGMDHNDGFFRCPGFYRSTLKNIKGVKNV